MKKFFIVIIVNVLLFGCSNTIPKIHYYLLNLPQQNTATSTIVAHKNATITIDLRLPDYLKQPNLVMLMKDNSLHFSHYNLWGENLSLSISKALQQDLGKFFLTANTKTTLQKKILAKTLVIEIDHFYPSEQGNAVFAGRYWFKGAKRSVYTFNLQQPLQQNGFANAVKQLRELLTMFATEISKHELT